MKPNIKDSGFTLRQKFSASSVKTERGFTLIELLVVVAIIALLSSVALIAMVSARQKSRNAKRISDMVQMLNGIELFNAANKGYPADLDTNGIPDGLSPKYVATLPKAPMPADSTTCEANYSPCGGAGQPACIPATTYYYVPKGTCQSVNGITICPDFEYYFCLGDKVGNFDAGVRVLTPQGVK